MGPQHPSTHGVIRFIIKTDGEIMREAIPDVGYLHRAHREASPRSAPTRASCPTPIASTTSAAMTANHVVGDRRSRSWPASRCRERGEYLRVISDELNRISSPLHRARRHGDGRRRDHAVPVRPARARVRQRPHRGALRRAPHVQLPPHRRRRLGHARRVARQGARAGCDHFEPIIDEFDRLITLQRASSSSGSPTWPSSPPTRPMACGLVGPNLRASRRRLRPAQATTAYSIYPEAQVRRAGRQRRAWARVGDCWDRF